MTFSIFAFLLVAGIGAGLTATLAGLASLLTSPIQRHSSSLGLVQPSPHCRNCAAGVNFFGV